MQVTQGVLNIPLGTTENGEISFTSTGDKNLDLFGTVNRDVSINVLINKFIDAWNENPELAIKTLLNFRDIKDGKGEKFISKIMMLIIKITNPQVYTKLIPLFVNVGCWKDLLFLYEAGTIYGTQDSSEISAFSQRLLEDFGKDRPSLCAKWAPSEGCHYSHIAKAIMRELQIDSKEYRKLLTSLRKKINIVESQLSQSRTEEIKFSTLPSRAHLLYRKAFLRGKNAQGLSTPERLELAKKYEEYLGDLKKGHTTANFKCIMPHEIIKKILEDSEEDHILLENQWNSLRENISSLGIFNRCLAIVDVSSSMKNGGRGGPPPIEVAIALGILVSECSVGIFKDKMFTFSERPQLIDLGNCETLEFKLNAVRKMPWGGSTNMESVFIQILQEGRLTGEIPERLFIFTDMQFNQVEPRGNSKTFDKIRDKYLQDGFQIPQIICWNLRTVDNTVFTKNDEGISMLSGFSPGLLKAFLTSKEFSPLDIYLAAVDHYEIPEVILKPIKRENVSIEKIMESCKI